MRGANDGPAEDEDGRAAAPNPGSFGPALDELRDALASIVERVDDLIIDVLREAVDSGASERPELERRLTRVRNALLRASSLLEH